MKKEKSTVVIYYNNPNFSKGKTKTIFTVCGLEGLKTLDKKRTFGWYSKLQQALEAVTGNACDIYEYSYTYMLIEEVKEGVFGTAIKEWWFKWDNKENAFHPISKPKETKRLINWGIG